MLLVFGRVLRALFDTAVVYFAVSFAMRLVSYMLLIISLLVAVRDRDVKRSSNFRTSIL